MMKIIMYSIGLLSSMSVSIEWVFKLLNLPGGGPLFNFGFLGFVLIFIPILAIDRYKVNIGMALSDKLRIILVFCSAIISGLAVVFKLLHLQGADVLLIVGALLFSLGFLPFLFYKMYQKSIE